MTTTFAMWKAAWLWPALWVLIVFRMAACTTPVSEPRNWGLGQVQIANRKHAMSHASQQEAMKNIRDCLTKVLYSGGAGIASDNTGGSRAQHTAQPPQSSEVSCSDIESTGESAEAAEEDQARAKVDSFATSSAFVASVPTQHGGSAFWVPPQNLRKGADSTSVNSRQNATHDAAMTGGQDQTSSIRPSLAEAGTGGRKVSLPTGGSGLTRAVSYDVLDASGTVDGQTHRLPHTEKRNVQAASEDGTASADSFEEVASSNSQDESTSGRKASAVETQETPPVTTPQGTNGQKRKPALWVPTRSPPVEAKPAATSQDAKKARPAPWLPPSATTQEKRTVEVEGKKPRAAMWLPGQGAAKPVEPPAPARKAMWLPNSAAAAKPAAPARGKPWVPPTASNGAKANADGWPAAKQGGWKPKYDMAKGMDDEMEAEAQASGPSWKPKYDVAKALKAAEAAPPVSRAAPKLVAGDGAKTPVQRSASPGTLKLQERRRELEEQADKHERRRQCDRCKQLCRGAWLMGYDMVHCSEGCLRATEEEVCGHWREGWDSVEAFLRPRGGPRMFPNAVVPGLGIRPK